MNYGRGLRAIYRINEMCGLEGIEGGEGIEEGLRDLDRLRGRSGRGRGFRGCSRLRGKSGKVCIGGRCGG